MAGGDGSGMPPERAIASSAALSVALHASLAVAIVFAPQIFRREPYPLPTLGVITATIEGSGSAQRSGAGARQPVAVPLPETPAPPVKAHVTPPAPPRATPDLTLPSPTKARPPQKVAKTTDDLRPDLPSIRRQPSPTPAPPAPVGPQTATTVPGPVASLPGPGVVDINRKDPGTPGTVDPLSYYFARIQDKLSTFWSPTVLPGDQEIQVVVGIRLLPNGQVSNVTIERSSGDRNFDDAAIRALRLALPLPPFPPLVRESSLDLRVRFTNKGVG